MKKSTKLLLILLVMLLAFSLVIMAACDPPADENSGTEDNDTETVTDSSAISNGSFASATGPTASYVKTNVTGWTISSGGSLSSSNSDVTAGVVDLFGDSGNQDAINSFNARKGEINAEIDFPGVDPKTPKTGDKYSDTNALVISIDGDGSNKGSIYFSASDEAVVKSGKYYKLTLSVWTHLLNNDGQPLNGAAIVIRGDTSVDYFSIDTQKNWQTYEIYIEGSDFEDREISIQLWLGHGPANFGSTSSSNSNYSPYFENGVNPYLAKGTVFFDNVKLDEVTAAEFTDAFNDVVNAKENSSDYADGYNQRYDSLSVEKSDGGRLTAVSMIYPDPNFTAYRAHTSSSSASTTKFFHSAKLGEPENYTFVVGKEGLSSSEKNKFPSYSTSANNDNPKGIFDFSKFYELQVDENGKPATKGDKDAVEYTIGDKKYYYTDLYNKLDSEFHAPPIDAFYTVDSATGKLTPITLPDGEAKDSTALLIYHPENAISGGGYQSDYEFKFEKNKYYVISVWVYIWVPEIDVPRIPRYTGMDGVTATEYDNNYDQWLADFEAGKQPVTDEDDDNYDADYNEFYKFMTWLKQANGEDETYNAENDVDKRVPNENSGKEDESEFSDFYNDYYLTDYQEYKNGDLKDYEDYMQFVKKDDGADEDVNKANKPKATVKLTGADIDDKYSTSEDIGVWEEITFYVQGNALADRNLQLEFWYGEGEWGDDTLYPGGCFFDNLTVQVYDDVDKIPDELKDEEWQQISVIEADSYSAFGLHDRTEPDDSIPVSTEKTVSDEDEGGWYYKPVDDRSKEENFDVKFIPYDIASKDGSIGAFSFTKAAESGDPADYEVQFDVIQYSHTDYTASTLYFIPKYNAGTEATSELHITPNKFYRLSLWAKTANFAEGSKFNVRVFDRETDEIINSSAAVTGIGELSDWTEISILFRANAVTANDIYIVIEFGEGDFFDDDGHAEGTIYLSAFTYQELSYSEYNDASTGTYVKKASLASSGSYGSVSNGNFGTISTDNYSEDEDREDGESIFDDGNLTGVADPDSWDDSTAHTPIAAPTVSTSEHSHIAWSVDGALEALLRKGVTFYIFMNDFTEEDGSVADDVPVYSLTVDEKENKNNLPKKATDGDFDFTYGNPDKDGKTLYNGEYYVRMVYTDGGKYYVSAASSVVNITGATAIDENKKISGLENVPSALGEDAVIMGVINSEYYDFSEVGRDKNYDLYDSTENSGYRSTSSKNLLMIHSKYETYAGYQSSSVTFSANSYYRISVWVKTIEGAKASVTLANTSNAYELNTEYPGYDSANNGRYEGYVNINTGGKWMRLDFYVSTGMNSARAEIELSLGNKYANNTLELAAGDTVTVGDKEESYDAVKVSYGLSSGTVFFDDVYMTSIDEAEYNALVYGFNNPEEADEEELKEELLKKNGDKYFYGLTAEEAAEIETMEKDELIDKLAEVREYNIVTGNETDGYTVNYQTAPYLDETTGIGNYFHNGYVFKLIKRFTDSFDNYDERDEEELYQGDEPASYDHHAYTGFSQGKDDNPTILFGVYDREYDLENSTYIGRLFSNEDNTALNKADITEEALMRFLSTGADDGDDKVLLLANLGEAGGQYYRSSSSFSFSAESYYKITFRAKYLPLGEAGHTEFRFVYNTSDNKYEALTITPNSINDINYTTYSFYFYNENGSSLSAYLQFNLGSNESIGDGEREELFNNGFLLVDNVTIENITEVNVDAEGVPGEYNAYLNNELEEGIVTGGYVNELVETEENPEDDPEDDPDEGGNKINPQVWLIVSSVVIGVIIIAVVIVLTYRKLKDKVSKKLKKTKVESKVPTDLEERAKKNELNRKAENKKTDIDAEDYRD